MKIASGVLVLMALAGVASAAAPIQGNHPVTREIQAQVDGGITGTSPTAVVRHYDNWTNPPSLLVGLFVAGTDEIADDLAMTALGAGLLSNMGINCANANGPSNLIGGQIAIRFYDNLGNYISGFNGNLPVLALPAGGSVRLSFGANSLNAFNIFLTQNCYVSLQWNTVAFSGAGTTANCGYQLRGPIAIGTSTDQLFDVTTATAFNFGGNPLANTGLFIDTEDVVATPTHATSWGHIKALYR